jgi:hypothetical protein
MERRTWWDSGPHKTQGERETPRLHHHHVNCPGKAREARVFYQSVLGGEVAVSVCAGIYAVEEPDWSAGCTRTSRRPNGLTVVNYAVQGHRCPVLRHAHGRYGGTGSSVSRPPLASAHRTGSSVCREQPSVSCGALRSVGPAESETGEHFRRLVELLGEKRLVSDVSPARLPRTKEDRGDPGVRQP